MNTLLLSFFEFRLPAPLVCYPVLLTEVKVLLFSSNRAAERCCFRVGSDARRTASHADCLRIGTLEGHPVRGVVCSAPRAISEAARLT